jgi:hypothetical protein
MLRPIPQSQIDLVTEGPPYPQNPWLSINDLIYKSLKLFALNGGILPPVLLILRISLHRLYLLLELLLKTKYSR